MRFNYNTSAYSERLWYSVHTGSTQYLYIYTLRYQHLLCVLSLYMYSVVYLQDRTLWYACERGDVVRAQEILALGANISYHHEPVVSDSAHIPTHPLVVACVVYQYSVYWYRLSEITLVHSRLICAFISH